MLSTVRPSVCLSVRLFVTRVDHTKTVEVRIIKFSPYGSPVTLVLQGKLHPEILRGSPKWRRQTREGWVKSASLSVNTSKTVAYTVKVTIND